MAEQKTFQASSTGAPSATNDVCPTPGGANDALEHQKHMARRQAEQIKAGARETAQEVRRKGAEMAHEAKETAREMKDRAIHSAAETAQQAQRRVMSLADEQKLRLAGELNTWGEAMSRAADKLREDNDQRIAGYAELAADQLRSTADYLNARTCGELCGDVENFARRRPEVFYGGMLLLGLGIARFLKASRRPRRHDYGEGYEGYEGYEGDEEFGGPSRSYGNQYSYGGEQSRPTYAGGMYGQPSYRESSRQEGASHGSSFDRSSTTGGASMTGGSAMGRSSGQASSGASSGMASSGPSQSLNDRKENEAGCECPPTSSLQSNQETFPESKEPAKGETEKSRSMNDPLSYH